MRRTLLIGLTAGLAACGLLTAFAAGAERGGASGTTSAATTTTTKRLPQLGPAIIVRPGRPRAGRAFTPLVAWLPVATRFHVVSVRCDATLGAHWVQVNPSSRVLEGGLPIRPILRRRYRTLKADGRRHLHRVTCGWRLPRSPGRLLSLAVPGCSDGCKRWGFSIEYTDDAQSWTKPARQDFTGKTWKLER
jgi:hypothetical protein